MPTETVYGLAADARNAEAVAKVFALKQRPLDHPLIVHLASAADLDRWAATVPETARRFAGAAWPGPLTLVLPARDEVPRQVTGGQDTVALRVPDHPLALKLIQGAGGALVAPSANRFGRLSPSRAEHVLEGFGDTPPPVLDGGPCRVGIGSTVVFVDGAGWQILRPGHWTAAALERIAGTAPAPAGRRRLARRGNSPRTTHRARRCFCSATAPACERRLPKATPCCCWVPAGRSRSIRKPPPPVSTICCTGSMTRAPAASSPNCRPTRRTGRRCATA
jgi:L-threonylcarbamoyladenylate synthase